MCVCVCVCCTPYQPWNNINHHSFQQSFNSSSDEGDMGVETAHAANGSSAVGPTETPQAQQEQQQQEKHTKGDKYAPCALYEDGTMMFTAEALQEVNYEDVLTS